MLSYLSSGCLTDRSFVDDVFSITFIWFGFQHNLLGLFLHFHVCECTPVLMWEHLTHTTVFSLKVHNWCVTGAPANISEENTPLRTQSFSETSQHLLHSIFLCFHHTLGPCMCKVIKTIVLLVGFLSGMWEFFSSFIF